jgi:hypothetical protein
LSLGPSIWSELKRRKVVRVAVVYAATAFAVLQAADIMLPQMNVPDWAMGLLVSFVVFGFPIALVLGWALEVTPDGIKRTEAAPAATGDAAIPAAARQAHGAGRGFAGGGRCRAWGRLVPAARGRIARRVAARRVAGPGCRRGYGSGPDSGAG